MLRFSHSKINAFKACPKKYELTYEKELAPLEEAKALAIGKALHTGIELHDEEALIEYMDSSEFFISEKGETEKGLVLAMVDAYYEVFGIPAAVAEVPYFVYEDEPDKEIFDLEQWKEDFENAEIGTMWYEVPFEVKLEGFEDITDEEVYFRGFIDGIEKWDDGVARLHELKSTSRMDKAYIDKLTYVDQITRYIWAAEKHFDIFIDEVIYRVIKKPTIRQKSTESIMAFRKRLVDKFTGDERDSLLFEFKLNRSEKQIEDALADMKEDLIAILSAERYTKNCQQCAVFGACQFMPLCMNDDDPDTYEDKLLLYKKRESR